MNSPTDDIYRIAPLKRFFDIIVSSILLVTLSPFFICILLLISLEHFIRERKFVSPFYLDIRLSQSREFGLIKFNIFKHSVIARMKERGEFIHTKKLEHNGSVIWVGILLRQIYFDEFPQLINVLKGDMSIVGPRPVNREGIKERISQGDTTKPFIVAGMTGYFQAEKGKNKSDMELDKDYMNFLLNNSQVKIVLNDIKTILRTIKVVLRAAGE